MLYDKQFDKDLNQYGEAKINVIIASTGRSGSHFLGHKLIEHGGAGVPFEYFNSGNMAKWKYILKINKHEDFVKKIRSIRCSPSTGVFSAKIHYSQLEELAPYSPFKKMGNVKYIHVKRRNVLKQAISMSIARQTGKWISEMPSNGVVPNYSRNEIEQEMRAIIRDNASWYFFFAQNGIDFKEVIFEDLINNTDQVLQDVYDFIGIDSNANVNVELKSINKQSNSVNEQWLEKYLNDSAKSIYIRDRRFGKCVRKVKSKLKSLHSLFT